MEDVHSNSLHFLLSFVISGLNEFEVNLFEAVFGLLVCYN